MILLPLSLAFAAAMVQQDSNPLTADEVRQNFGMTYICGAGTIEFRPGPNEPTLHFEAKKGDDLLQRGRLASALVTARDGVRTLALIVEGDSKGGPASLEITQAVPVEVAKPATITFRVNGSVKGKYACVTYFVSPPERVSQ